MGRSIQARPIRQLLHGFTLLSAVFKPRVLDNVAFLKVAELSLLSAVLNMPCASLFTKVSVAIGAEDVAKLL